jgi:phospholipid/cholesterol/gamma-HCH transport system substrate-binding protein
MASRDKRTETLVGLFLFIGLALLGTLIVLYGRSSDKLRSFYTVTVEFKDASGVIKGSKVSLGGAPIGQVIEKPELGSNRRVKVVMGIRDDVPLPTNSVFQIISLSLLGDKAIVVSIPEETSEKDLADGAFLQGGGPSGLEAIQGDAESIAADVRDLLPKIDAALDEMRAVAGHLSEGVERINSGLLSDENIASFGKSLASLERTTGTFEEAALELKPMLVEARASIQQVGGVAEEATETFAKASAQIENLEPALREVPAAVRSISKVADSASAAIDDMKDGDGLLGTLAYDKEIKSDSKNFVRNLRRYGILGYRDDETYDENDPRERFRGRRR